VAPLPDYVSELLAGTKPTFIQPAYGIPDDNDASDWQSLRSHFGLPTGETQTLFDEIPETVTLNGYSTMWGGIDLYLTPCIELLPLSQVDTTAARVVLSGTVSGQETALIIENRKSWLINSGVVHLEASYVLSSLLGGPINNPAGADIVMTDSIGLIFSEYTTDVNVNLPWSGITRVVRYEPFGDVVSDVESDLQGNFSASMARGELVILNRLTVSCCDGIRGNVDGAGTINISDLTYLVNFFFRNGAEPPCPAEGDVDGNGGMDIADLTYIVGYMFRDGAEPPPCP
jgi:hypothetical protein